MRKNKQFSIRISEQDLETIRRKAAQAHMSQSDYVISCCLGKKIIILDGLKEVLRQQKAIGNNLNQLKMCIRDSCKGCCGLVTSSYRKTVRKRLQPQPFTVLLIS